MDQVEKLNHYRSILKQIIEMHAQMPGIPETVKGFAICDPVHDQYLLMDIGWYPDKSRAYDVVVHLRLEGDKVVIERDGIEYGVRQDLIEAGIPPEDIFFASDLHHSHTQTELLAA